MSAYHVRFDMRVGAYREWFVEGQPLMHEQIDEARLGS
jgi:hypothetical protein